MRFKPNGNASDFGSEQFAVALNAEPAERQQECDPKHPTREDSLQNAAEPPPKLDTTLHLGCSRQPPVHWPESSSKPPAARQQAGIPVLPKAPRTTLGSHLDAYDENTSTPGVPSKCQVLAVENLFSCQSSRIFRHLSLVQLAGKETWTHGLDIPYRPVPAPISAIRRPVAELPFGSASRIVLNEKWYSKRPSIKRLCSRATLRLYQLPVLETCQTIPLLEKRADALTQFLQSRSSNHA
jgi:hypothetical protein